MGAILLRPQPAARRRPGGNRCQITITSSTKDILATLDEWQGPLYKSLENSVAPLVAKSLTSKIQNLFLSKYHFLTRGTSLLSSPYGLIVDPMNACQLACPGCVHSARSKELKIFDWGPGILSETMFADFMRRYGPYAIEAEFCNYGEPLLNPNTPKFIRLAKTYLMRTMLSTNIGVKHFDPEAYVNSGLDYMTVSIDGATQSVYEKYRRKGDIETVYKNVRSLTEAKKRLGKRTPTVSWQYLAFEHNEHEIDDAIKMARQLGVDQFIVATPFDVSWDAPEIRPSKVGAANRPIPRRLGRGKPSRIGIRFLRSCRRKRSNRSLPPAGAAGWLTIAMPAIPTRKLVRATPVTISTKTW